MLEEDNNEKISNDKAIKEFEILYWIICVLHKNVVLYMHVNTSNKYQVVELYKQENTFYFKYILDNVKEAQKAGFKLLVAFPQINALYDNPKLFANFAARLPEPTRPEIKEILATYGMTEYDDFELLKRSGAKLPTDDYEFVR